MFAAHMLLAVDPVSQYFGVLSLGNSAVLIDSRLSAVFCTLDAGNVVQSRIACVHWSGCGRYIVLSLESKQAPIWRVQRDALGQPESFQYFRSIPMARNTSALTVLQGDLVIADKTGDLYRVCIESSDGPTLIAGHIAINLAVVGSTDGSYVVTGDREHKICVHHYPNAYNIHHYCLGHLQYVNALATLSWDPALLLSASADGTVRLWNICDGKQLYALDITDGPEGGIVSGLVVHASQKLAFAFLHAKQSLHVLSLDATGIARTTTISLPFLPLNIAVAGAHLWILGRVGDSLALYQLDVASNTLTRMSVSDSEVVSSGKPQVVDLAALLQANVQARASEKNQENESDDEAGADSKRTKQSA